jgi:glycerophosphoryl diester phosphodiesterase
LPAAIEPAAARRMNSSPAVGQSRPLVIAHRGASGYLPEHTLPAKAVAHAMGADFLEQDVVATRDGHLIVFHDLYLDDLTDVSDRFPGRARDDGRHYCIDLDLQEIRTLRVRERVRPGTREALYAGRFPAMGGSFEIPTLEDELHFIQGLNHSTGRLAGIYPEIKAPAWHRAQGIDVASQLLEILRKFGYSRRGDPAIVQCFDADELRRVRHALGSDLRLVQLLEGQGARVDSAGLEDIASYADGIGPGLKLLAAVEESGSEIRSKGLVQAAHQAGLHVHPYTLRADRLPPGYPSFAALMHHVLVVERVDGVFTDFPDQVIRFLGTLAKPWPPGASRA